MAGIAEGIAARIAYKFYTSGDITSNALADITTQPGQTGGKSLRRVASTLGLQKPTYRSQEKRSDRQVADMRHGARQGGGNISGEFSPATYFDFIQATHRDTAAAPVVLTKSVATLTSIQGASGDLVFGGGDPVAAGLGVGDIFRITGATAAAANGQNFLITGFSGTSNRNVDTFPAMPNFAADTGSWTITRPGRVTAPPSSGFVKRKLAAEIAYDDMGGGFFFPEHRVTGYRIGLPVDGMNTFETSLMGRDRKVLDATSSPVFPYFTAPAAPTTTGVTGPMDGVLLVNGLQVGLVTGLNIAAALTASVANVRSQRFPAEVFTGEFAVTGDLTAFFEGFDLARAFTDETELSLLTTVFSDTTNAAEGISIYLPRIKLSSGDNPLNGDAGQTFSGQFQALKYQGSAPGVAQTTIRLHDTAAL